MQLENKVAIVTGASSGIGRAIALAFAVNYRATPKKPNHRSSPEPVHDDA